MKKITKYILVGTMLGTMIVAGAGCSSPSVQSSNQPSASISEEVSKRNELPSYYKCYNIYENPEIKKEYGIAYYKLSDEPSNFINRLLKLNKVSVEDAKYAINEFESKPELAEESYADGNMEILTFDKSSVLVKYNGNEAKAYGLIQVKDDKGYFVMFFNNAFKAYSNSNSIVEYSNDDKRIITYNKSTGNITILEDVVYLGCDNEIVSFAKLNDNENIYNFDIKSMQEEKEKIDNLNVYDNYVSYKTIDKNFNAVDLLTSEKHVMPLGQENFWIKLSDDSIVYVTKNGNENRYQNFYSLSDGNFDKDYCVLSNLSTYPDENGNYTSYKNCIYFNKKLDRVYEVPYYKEMLENDTNKGYIKYLENDKSESFVDLTTGKRYYLKNTISSNEYTIYNVHGADGEFIDCSIFKDKNGTTISELPATFATKYVQKYFDDEKIAIQCDFVNDDRTIYFNPKIVDLSEFNNPNVILSSTNPNNFNLISTPISTIFKVYWSKEEKYSLIDISGNILTEKVDRIDFVAYENEGTNEAGYVVNLGTKTDNNQFEYTNIYFDINGNLVDGKSYQKTIKHN